MNDAKYIGLDVHQATISVAVLDSAGTLVMEAILETKAKTILQIIVGLRGSLHVTLEEGTCAAWLHDLLKQAQHERNELQTDAQNCGYSRNSTYDGGYREDGWGNQGRDDRWRNQDRDYDRGYSNNGPSGYNTPGYDVGYRDGVAMGQKDSQKGKSFRPQKNDRYEDADNGYNKSYGDKNQYKSAYREGFQRGYSDAYRQRR